MRVNKHVVFTPALWAKWVARRETVDPHTPKLRAGIEEMRREFARREARRPRLFD